MKRRKNAELPKHIEPSGCLREFEHHIGVHRLQLEFFNAGK